jgi:hypothetical protein
MPPRRTAHELRHLDTRKVHQRLRRIVPMTLVTPARTCPSSLNGPAPMAQLCTERTSGTAPAACLACLTGCHRIAPRSSAQPFSPRGEAPTARTGKSPTTRGAAPALGRNTTRPVRRRPGKRCGTAGPFDGKGTRTSFGVAQRSGAAPGMVSRMVRFAGSRRGFPPLGNGRQPAESQIPPTAHRGGRAMASGTLGCEGGSPSYLAPAYAPRQMSLPRPWEGLRRDDGPALSEPTTSRRPANPASLLRHHGHTRRI